MKSLLPKPPQNLTPAQIIEYYSIPEPNSGCWLWLGATCQGYGRLGTKPAHRASWEVANSKEIPKGSGLHTMHSCDNPGCVNPAHLSIGTMADNIKDAARKGRMARGERHYASKLTEDKVREIRTNGMGRNAAARHFGVCWMTITHIRQRKKWAWVSD